MLSHVYDDFLLSMATAVATPSGESSVWKRQQMLLKRHYFLVNISVVLVLIFNSV